MDLFHKLKLSKLKHIPISLKVSIILVMTLFLSFTYCNYKLTQDDRQNIIISDGTNINISDVIVDESSYCLRFILINLLFLLCILSFYLVNSFIKKQKKLEEQIKEKTKNIGNGNCNSLTRWKRPKNKTINLSYLFDVVEENKEEDIEITSLNEILPYRSKNMNNTIISRTKNIR